MAVLFLSIFVILFYLVISFPCLLALTKVREKVVTLNNLKNKIKNVKKLIKKQKTFMLKQKQKAYFHSHSPNLVSTITKASFKTKLPSSVQNTHWMKYFQISIVQ